jgi:putative RNA 2'-phosphotransferase
MSKDYYKQYSKYMSFILRHHPEELDITLEDGGWAPIDTLVEGMTANGYEVTKEVLEDIVASSDKQRFAINEEGNKIRANQGHSVDVKLQLKKEVPPFELYHGTVEKFIGSIVKEGLKKMNRHHVHLSEDKETATKVGSRRGKPVILTINAREMYTDGYDFYKSENGVWLTDTVPIQYLN